MKANELVEIFYRTITRAKEAQSFEIALTKNSFEFNRAKQCALIAVDKMILAIKFTNDSKHYVGQHKYLSEVKEEINKL